MFIKSDFKSSVFITSVVFSFFLLFTPLLSHASSTDGTIDATNRYAWNENTGWIDFGSTAGNVHVTNSGLTGYGYGENIGWISLNCSNTSSCGTVNYGVVNDGSGILSGYAWSENTGWINFAPSTGGVTIDSNGTFSGTAYSENVGWIIFNCSTTSSCGGTNYTMTTDWRPASASGGGGFSSTITIINGVTYITKGGVVSVIGATSTTPIATSGVATTTATTTPTTITPRTTATTTSGVTVSNITITTSNFIFTRDLHIGIIGSDVKELQQYLNAHGFIVAATGAGSVGHETSYFGNATKQTLVKFQKAKGIKPAVGYFGPVTRAQILNN